MHCIYSTNCIMYEVFLTLFTLKKKHNTNHMYHAQNGDLTYDLSTVIERRNGKKSYLNGQKFYYGDNWNAMHFV